MKIRSGFVSNSSSSSFIVASADPHSKKLMIVIREDITHLVDVVIQSEEELDDDSIAVLIYQNGFPQMDGIEIIEEGN